MLLDAVNKKILLPLKIGKGTLLYYKVCDFSYIKSYSYEEVVTESVTTSTTEGVFGDVRATARRERNSHGYDLVLKTVDVNNPRYVYRVRSESDLQDFLAQFELLADW